MHRVGFERRFFRKQETELLPWCAQRSIDRKHEGPSLQNSQIRELVTIAGSAKSYARASFNVGPGAPNISTYRKDPAHM